jgi:hypothetical protein
VRRKKMNERANIDRNGIRPCLAIFLQMWRPIHDVRHSDTILAVGNRLAAVMHRLANMVCFDPTVLESLLLEFRQYNVVFEPATRL